MKYKVIIRSRLRVLFKTDKALINNNFNAFLVIATET
jgi:hypothetical protein